MILGSHNTMTYLPIKQWYLKPLYWAARCQSKTIQEQYSLGVRMFDLRIRFDKNDCAYFAHGIFNFKGDTPSNVLEWLNKQSDSVYVRIILESNSKMKDQEYQEKLFKEFCEFWNKNTSVILFGGNRKYDWDVIYDFGVEEPTLDDKYSSTTGTKIDDLWPWLYARLNNKSNIQNGTNKDVLFIDFIGSKFNK